jgi:hypothetical protein
MSDRHNRRLVRRSAWAVREDGPQTVILLASRLGSALIMFKPAGNLQPCHAGPRARRRGPHEQSTLGSTRQRMTDSLRDHYRVQDVDLALQALAEQGVGLARQRRRRRRSGPRGDPSRSTQGGIKVRTFVDGRGPAHACTPDGWPAHEPWPGAAIHAHESRAMDPVMLHALDGLLGPG